MIRRPFDAHDLLTLEIMAPEMVDALRALLEAGETLTVAYTQFNDPGDDHTDFLHGETCLLRINGY